MADMISRVAACECIGKMIHEYREKGENAIADGMILARRYGIKCLPAVDAIPVEWLRQFQDKMPNTAAVMGVDVVLKMWEQEAR